MKTVHNGIKSGLVLALLAMPAVVMAAEGSSDKDIPRLGMSPGEPQVRSATPSVPFGIQPADSKQNSFDFHGYLLLPAYVGVHERADPGPGQGDTVLHSPPLMAQYLRRFEYTGVVPSPWLQLNFLYGNSTLYATAIVAATAVTEGAGYHDVVAQAGVKDAFVTANLSKSFGFPFMLHAGAMSGRYGGMGAWDAGRYGTPLIARTNTIGESIVTGYKVKDFFLVLEEGVGGQLGRPSSDMVGAGWNDWADPNVGATFVAQGHLGVAYRDLARLGLHYIRAWTQDDQGPGGVLRKGHIAVAGADLQVTAKRAGHLYLGFARTDASDASSVSGAIEIMNARGGPDLVESYLGPASGGNGSLNTFGVQYDISIARAVFGDLYQGMSPDILVSLFGVGTQVKSQDVAFDGVFKVKGGAEVTYLPLSWFGISERFDHVRLHGSDSKQAFSIFSSRLLFHTGWKSRGQMALQYSHFVYGGDVYVTTGYPPHIDKNINPDRDVFSLSGTYWW
jgi:hypothetical protein